VLRQQRPIPESLVSLQSPDYQRLVAS
jgi:hypothetical protein